MGYKISVLRNPIVVFLNYLNIYFLKYRDADFLEWLKLRNDTESIKSLQVFTNNQKLPVQMSNLFLVWFLKNCKEELSNLYYAIMEENTNLAFQWVDCLQIPPEINWLVFPTNLKNLLNSLNQKREPKPKQITYEDKEWKFTNLEEL